MAPSDFPPFPASASARADDEPGARAIDLSDRPIAESLAEVLASRPIVPIVTHPAAAGPPPLPVRTAGVAPAFKNRHWTLASVGVLGLLIAFIHGGRAAVEAGRYGVDSLLDPTQPAGSTILHYSLRAAWWLTLGLGLIFARRWARHLWLAQAVCFLVGGLVMSLAGVADAWPEIASGEIWFRSDRWIAWITPLFWPILGWVGLAALCHPNVRLTCEAVQPRPGWADRLSPSELCLYVLAVYGAIEAMGLGPGSWPFEQWGGALLVRPIFWLVIVWTSVAAGPADGVGKRSALRLVAFVLLASVVGVTELQPPSDHASPLWGPLGPNRHGGWNAAVGWWGVVGVLAIAAVRSRRRASLAPAT